MSCQIKENFENDEIELWVDGEFRAGWNMVDIPKEIKPVIEGMLDKAVEAGEHNHFLKVRKLICGI